jgi:hypothetical protein
MGYKCYALKAGMQGSAYAPHGELKQIEVGRITASAEVTEVKARQRPLLPNPNAWYPEGSPTSLDFTGPTYKYPLLNNLY